MADKTVTVRPADGDYTTLAGAVAGEATDLVNSLEGMLYIKIEGDWSGGADTTQVEFNGYTTDATHYIKVYTDSANRAGTSWNTSKYILATSDENIIRLFEDYIWIDGLQMTVTDPTSTCDVFQNITRSSGEIKVSNSIIKGHGNDSYRFQLYTQASGVFTDLIMWNCICYNWGAEWNSVFTITSGCTGYLYNITVINDGSDYGIRNNGGTLTCKNCYAGGATYDDFKGTISITTCASSDTTGTTDNIAINTTNFTNVTGGSEDWALPVGSGLIGVGTDDVLAAAATDINDVSRTSTWDIGADEYVAGGGEEYVGSGSITIDGIAVTSHTTDYGYSGSGFIITAGSSTTSCANDFVYQSQGTITTSGIAIFSRTTYYVFQASGTTTAGGKAATSYTNNYSYQGQGTITTAGIAETSYIPSFVYQGQGVIITAGIATTSYTTYYIYQGQGTTTSGGKATTEYSVEHEYQGQGTITLSGIAEATSGVEYTYQGQGEITTAGIAITSYIPSFVYQGQGEITTTGLATTSYTNDFSYQGQGVITLSGIAATSYTEVEVEYIYQGQGEITTAGLATTSCTNYFSYQGQGEIIISGSAITESSTGYEYQGQGTITLSGIARTYLVYITETITNYSTITILVDEKSAIENEVDETSSIQILVDNKSQIGKIIDELSPIKILVDEKSII